MVTTVVLLDDDDQSRTGTAQAPPTSDLMIAADEDTHLSSADTHSNGDRKEREQNALKEITDLLGRLDKMMMDEKMHDEMVAKRLAKKKAKASELSNGWKKGTGYGT
jgi:hypothetical protein